jgi:Tfp pilus assembly protein PilF
VTATRKKWAAGMLAVLLVACSAGLGSSSQRGRRAAQPATPAQLEHARDRQPHNAKIRNDLGAAYYRRARAALDAGRSQDYERDLELAMREWIESLRIDPTSSTPHTMMAIVAAYQGDLDRTLQSLANARRLAPDSWVSYTNIAQVMIYRGRSREALRWMDRAQPLRPNPAVMDLNMALHAWRDGYLDSSRKYFQRAYRLDPEVVNTWDEAPVADPIESFEDFTRYCCWNPACGPYMADACQEQQLEVRRRELDAETVRKELIIEMERRRELEKIYQQRKELKIEVERPAAGAE